MDSNPDPEAKPRPPIPDTASEDNTTPQYFSPETIDDPWDNLALWLEDGSLEFERLVYPRIGLWSLEGLKTAVRWLTYEGFVNGREDQLDIIQVLRGHPGLDNEIALERSRRARETSEEPRVPAFDDLYPAEDSWPARVRLQSPWLLKLLGELAGQESWDLDIPRVFFSPFQAFRFFLPAMKSCLKALKERKHVNTSDHVPPTTERTGETSQKQQQTTEETDPTTWTIHMTCHKLIGAGNSRGRKY
jgi:hypothetical protein